MPSLSKPIYSLLGTYFEQLFNNPIRTKSITSCVIASSANIASQSIAGVKTFQTQSVFAYGLFGLLFGGTIPHYFYGLMEKLIPHGKYAGFCQFLGERLVFAPFYAALSLYFLARFEGKNHENALNNLMGMYGQIIKANWRYLSLPVFINFTFVPPMLRVLFANLIGFFWIIFVADKRRRAQKREEAAKSK